MFWKTKSREEFTFRDALIRVSSITARIPKIVTLSEGKGLCCSVRGTRRSRLRFFAALRMTGLCLALGLSGCAHYEAKPIRPEQTADRFDARTLSDPALCSFLETNLHRSFAEWPPKLWDVETLTYTAFYYQPCLAVARAAWAEAMAAQTSAGERPNPAVSFTPTYDTTTSPPWIPGVSFDIPIETAGKRGHRVAQARHLSEAARWDFVTVAWQVRSHVRSSLLNLYAARQTESLLTEQESAQAEVVRLLDGQLGAGNVSEFDVTQARISLDTTHLTLQDARRQEVEALGKLADALGLPLRALGNVPLSFVGLAGFPTTLTTAEVRRQAVLNRADVRGALAEYAASQSALQLEIAKQYPDIHLGPGYELDQTDNKWTLGATVTLPVLNQNQGAGRRGEGETRTGRRAFSDRADHRHRRN